jgi:hypothetical protein
MPDYPDYHEGAFWDTWGDSMPYREPVNRAVVTEEELRTKQEEMDARWLSRARSEKDWTAIKQVIEFRSSVNRFTYIGLRDDYRVQKESGVEVYRESRDDSRLPVTREAARLPSVVTGEKGSSISAPQKQRAPCEHIPNMGPNPQSKACTANATAWIAYMPSQDELLRGSHRTDRSEHRRELPFPKSSLGNDCRVTPSCALLNTTHGNETVSLPCHRRGALLCLVGALPYSGATAKIGRPLSSLSFLREAHKLPFPRPGPASL